MRTFVALSVSVGAVRRVAEVVEKKAAELGERGARIAWVPPAQYHVTLQFLGDIPEESVDAIALCLRRRLADLPPLALRLSGTGSFPLGADPRVLWVGIDGGKPLLALQAQVRGDLQALGFVKPGPDDPPYHPHLTVARVPEGVSLAAAEWQSELALGEDVSTEVVVYESRLPKEQPQKSHRGGVEYRVRARVPFSKMR